MVTKIHIWMILMAATMHVGPLSSHVKAQEMELAAKTGREFLVKLFDQELGLLPEYDGAPVYWLYHDNYLAAKVLQKTHPNLSRTIVQSIQRQGIKGSGKIEILFGESKKPLPFREYQLSDVKKVDGKTIRTELVTSKILRGWEAYADLRFFAALALAESDAKLAGKELVAGLAMWDGKGFNDAVVKSAKRYATYKISLAILAAARLGKLDLIPQAAISRLKAMQNKAGGWVTDYRADGRPVGLANVETSSLAILSLEALAKAQQKTGKVRP